MMEPVEDPIISTLCCHGTRSSQAKHCGSASQTHHHSKQILNERLQGHGLRALILEKILDLELHQG